MGKGNNRELIAEFCGKLPCQVGGGIRSAENARQVLKAGAKRVILGSSLIKDRGVDTAFANALCEEFGAERLVMAIDSRGGRVAIHGWKTITEITPAEMMEALEPYCSAFLYTHIDTEGFVAGNSHGRGAGAEGADDRGAHRGRRDLAASGRSTNSMPWVWMRWWGWRFIRE